MKKLASKARLANSRGFSLFEILIVIGIAGALMAAVIPKVLDSQAQAKVKQTKLTINSLVQNLTLYQNDCQKFPGSLDGLAKADDCKNWTGPYMKTVPLDAWNTAFIYESDGNSYKLKSLGSDKKEGGDGTKKDMDADEIQ